MDIGSNITSIIISAITAITTIVTIVIQTKKNNAAIEKTSEKIEKTSMETRQMLEVNDYKTYLLLLIADYPSKVDEILYVARHYFEDLDGNTFVINIFEDWLNTRNIIHPEWFQSAKKRHQY